ncbi:2OG-Fe dioxygenase family protein [Rhizosaccharibacter radicis]|uniref:2OG-Fe dioxygenase family protein n=1 Tax=Rhizosaccharibacter radicis TaxID=2782605 RepID=A0ABT1VVL7_9PROT|nr:2OG-Fe dioxygenase family protein [Acetobacteraceae bacterium KSS12]
MTQPDSASAGPFATGTHEGPGATLSADGYAFVPAAGMLPLLEPYGFRDWDGFARSWNDLGMDRYMADGGRYRRRRHAVFAVSADGVDRKPHQPHYQSRDYNPLNGGIERWFSPMEDHVAAHPAMQAILRCCFALFDGLTPPPLRPAAWHVETHQFRVEARAHEAGKPTPEGMHRDGVDWVLVLLVARENIERGDTAIQNPQGRMLGSFTLESPLDAALVDDARVAHGVTAVQPLRPGQPAFRDVLVVTFRR